MSDRCQRCGEVPNPDGSCACPKQQAPNSLAATMGSAMLGNFNFAWIIVYLRNCGERARATLLARDALGITLTEASKWVDSVKFNRRVVSMADHRKMHDEYPGGISEEQLRDYLRTEVSHWPNSDYAWTATKPTQRGFYWRRSTFTHMPTIAFVFEQDGQWWASNPFPACSFKARLDDKVWDHEQWAGPIPEPTHNAEVSHE